jgi:hypothetical protein
VNNIGKQRVAQVIAAGLNAEQVRVGDSSVAPEPTQTALQGTTIATGNGALVVTDGATVQFLTSVSLTAGEIVGEAGLFDSDGRMLDRWVFGPLATAAEGSLVPTWKLEVL